MKIFVKNVTKLFVLVASCAFKTDAMFEAATMNNSFEVVQFIGNDISDNIISREYFAKCKALTMRSIEMFGGKQLTRTIAASYNYNSEPRKKYNEEVNKLADDVCNKNILAIEQELFIAKAEKENMIQNLRQEKNAFVQQNMRDWDSQAEKFYMLELLPKICMSIATQLIDTELEKQFLDFQNKIDNKINITPAEDMLRQNVQTLHELLDEQNLGRILALLKSMFANENPINDDKQKIDKIENQCLCTKEKFGECFGNSNEYFIFIGDNPAQEKDSYKIESILPRKYLNKKTKLAIVIPGSVGGRSVQVGTHAFFRLFHCNEQLIENIRIKLIFKQVDGQKVVFPSDLSNMFDDFQYEANGLKVVAIDFSGVYFPEPIYDMSAMFRNCRNLTQLDLNNFDTSSVEHMEQMFSKCVKLQTLNINNFNTSNVVNMAQMFRSCKSLKKLDLSNFNTKDVEDMSRLFYKCKELRTLDLSNFDVSNVETITDMFAGCKKLQEVKIKQTTLNLLLKKDKNLFRDCNNLQIVYA